MHFEKDATGKRGTLTLEGELMIQRAGELRDALVQAHQEVESVLLNLEAVSGADISCLQVLCSAHHTAVLSKKTFGFTGGIPAAFKQTIEDAGYAKEVCSGDGEGSCLWAMIRGEQ